MNIASFKIYDSLLSGVVVFLYPQDPKASVGRQFSFMKVQAPLQNRCIIQNFYAQRYEKWLQNTNIRISLFVSFSIRYYFLLFTIITILLLI